MLKLKFLFSLLVSCFVIHTASADPKYWLRQMQIAELNKMWHLTMANVLNYKTLQPTSTQIYQQKLDHFNDQEQRTFKQRYWINKSYSQDANSPVLLFICGEGACSSNNQFFIADHARELKASIVILEHRYYGDSQPFPDLSTENLQFLTVAQALEDLNTFKTFSEKRYQLSGPWITVGGSYPGALSAYMRTLYPNQFIGALASSAPVLADNDFAEYDRHVSITSGPACAAAVRKIVDAIEIEIIDDQKFDSTKAEFNASALNDRDDFLYLLADTAAVAVQYGQRKEFCQLVENEGRAGYVKAVELMSQVFGNLVNFSAQAAEDISLGKNSGNIGMRQWFYQSCTEFGYWQNYSKVESERARSKRINASYHANICRRLFNMDSIADAEKTNAKYYKPILNSASQILFTNGSEDPWVNLSIAEQNGNIGNENLNSFVIQGAAHCDDLGRSSNNSKIKEAQDLFAKLAKQWLQ